MNATYASAMVLSSWHPRYQERRLKWFEPPPPILLFDPPREHSSVPTAEAHSHGDQGLSRLAASSAATCLALIGPGHRGTLSESGLMAHCAAALRLFGTYPIDAALARLTTRLSLALTAKQTHAAAEGGVTDKINDLFAKALGIDTPWFVDQVDFSAKEHRITIHVDFMRGSRFSHPKAEGEHRVHDTQIKQLRHLNFFQHDCYFRVRVPRVKLPDGKVALVEPEWAGQLSGFTLLFEALVLTLAQDMPFLSVARTVGESWHRVNAICSRYVDLATAKADLSATTSVAIDETSYQRGHKYLTLVADTDTRRVLYVCKGRSAETVGNFVTYLYGHNAKPCNIKSVCIDMSPAFIKGVNEHLPNATITFDKFHVVAHARKAVDETRRIEQKADPALKGLRWTLLKDVSKLTPDQKADLNCLVAQYTTKRTARAWLYCEQLRDILSRKQINVVSKMLAQWCTNVKRSKVEPMKKVADMIRAHFDGIVKWTQSRVTNGFIEAINGLFQAAKRKARGYTRFKTMRTVIFLISGKLNFSAFNPYIIQNKPKVATS